MTARFAACRPRPRSSRAGRSREAEIKTLPLTSRNPYNFALLQPGVVGFETNEFGVPRLTANGALLRVNYQVDGSNNTQKDRAGLRQMPMSEVMIREVKVVTTGYAPEFGQTMGLVYNAITPSGTNTYQRAGQLPHAAPVDGGDAVLHARSARSAQAADRRQRLHRSILAGRSSRTRPTSSAATSTPSAISRASASSRSRRPTRRRSASPSRSTSRAALNTEFAIGKVDHQINQAQPAVGALHVLRQLHHRQRRRRHRSRCSAPTTSPTGSTRPAPSSSRPSAPALAQRVPRPVRDPRAGARARTRCRARDRPSTSPDVANFGGPIAADGRRRLRVHAGRAADEQQLHASCAATTRSRRASTCSSSPTPAARRRPALHVPDVASLPGGGERREPVRLHVVHAVLRLPDLEYNTEPVRLLRPGRLARQRRT